MLGDLEYFAKLPSSSASLDELVARLGNEVGSYPALLKRTVTAGDKEAKTTMDLALGRVCILAYTVLALSKKVKEKGADGQSEKVAELEKKVADMAAKQAELEIEKEGLQQQLKAVQQGMDTAAKAADLTALKTEVQLEKAKVQTVQQQVTEVKKTTDATFKTVG